MHRKEVNVNVKAALQDDNTNELHFRERYELITPGVQEHANHPVGKVSISFCTDYMYRFTSLLVYFTSDYKFKV